MISKIFKKIINRKEGFTLIEIMVSISIFTIIMLIVSGAVLGVFDGNRKSQSMRAIMDNLNLGLESMTRDMRFGSRYHSHGCSAPADTTTRWDCATGNATTTILTVDGSTVSYSFETGGPTGSGRIVRTIGGVRQFLTSEDVNIDVSKSKFYVFGTELLTSSPLSCSTGKCLQPKVIIMASGTAGVKQSVQSSFILQTTVSQRPFDFQ